MRVAQRLENLPTYVFAELGKRIQELRAAGQEVIRLDIGSPDLPPPGPIVEAMHKSAQNVGNHGYSGFYGIPEFRKAVAAYYDRRFGVKLNPETEVVSLIGSKEGIANVALAYVDPGSKVLVPDPGYPPYTMGTILAGGVPVRVPLWAENGFLPDLDAIPAKDLRDARILWLNYPNNPTGATAPFEFLERAVRFGQETGILVCHDNPYCDVCFEGYEAPSLLQVPGAMEVALEFNSLSKTYNMAGWRVGMAVGNAAAVAALARTKTNIDSGIFRPLQDASVLALSGDQSWLEGRNRIYAERRDLIVAALAEMGIGARKPVASLYVWAETPEGWTSAEYARWLLEEVGISVTPGSVFGPHGEGYLRISLGMDTRLVGVAMERWKAAVGQRRLISNGD